MFEELEFKGTFRSCQQKVLDNAESFIKDGRINIVAAPGSGKTVLGLELIKRLAVPCLILSPTTTIRDQWCDRFTEGFMPDGATPADYISFDLRFPAPITSVTYQALYSAVERVKSNFDGEEVDYSDLDIFKTVKEAGFGALCLDEAHHLQNEWQRALEKFVSHFQGKVRIIALTATPPYDASAAEWERYVGVCGEIDEEISVPELVAEGALCPHQDYISFGYPTEEEASDIADYKERVKNALKELKTHPAMKEACRNLTMREADLNGWLDKNYKELSACVCLFKSAGLKPDRAVVRCLGVKNASFDEVEAELAVNFLIGEKKLLDDAPREKLKSLFKNYGLFERGRACLTMPDRLKRGALKSAGKLKSIARIAKFESDCLGDRLRLLVLTDFIGKENVSDIGSDARFDSVNVVSVFETVRKNCAYPCAAVSGSLVILPAECSKTLTYMGVNHKTKPIKGTEYAEFLISGGNREKVVAVGKLFEKGEVCALVGTKSLLGEGWDSPCVNSLILASFVGSFMLSNQMRGRAVRTDKNDPDKTANVWHLVTLLPDENILSVGEESDGKPEEEKLASYDFETLKRRFDCFVAPSYSFDRIESGIGRISVIEPPFDERGIERINRKTEEIAKNREELKRKWESSLAVSSELYRKIKVPSDRAFPAFTFYNISREFILLEFVALIILGIVELFIYSSASALNTVVACIGAVSVLIAVTYFSDLIRLFLLKHSNPEKSIKNLADCVLAALKACGKIQSDGKTEVDSNDIGTVIEIKLTGATLREQKIFTEAVGELFSPIEGQRYVLVPRGMLGYNYKNALACPSLFSANKNSVTKFTDELKRTTGKLSAVYTRTPKGYKILRKCRKRAYITANSRNVEEMFGNC